MGLALYLSFRPGSYLAGTLMKGIYKKPNPQWPLAGGAGNHGGTAGDLAPDELVFTGAALHLLARRQRSAWFGARSPTVPAR